jgi:hypothetical protein
VGLGSYLRETNIYISAGASLEFTGNASITQDTYVELHGTFIFNTNNWFNFQNAEIVGTGLLDLTGVTGCGVYNSIVNGKNAAKVLNCQQINDLGLINVNIWDGQNWSGGQAPKSCLENALIQGDYSTANGNVLVGNITVENGYEVDIIEGTYFDICNRFTNQGEVRVHSGGSLIQREGSELIDNGLFVVQREDNLDQFKYQIWSSPVIGQQFIENIFYNSNPCDMYVFEAQEQVWKYDFPVGHQTTCNGVPVQFSANDVIVNGDGILNTAYGYFVPGASTGPVTREFYGTVHNGPIKSRISTTNLGANALWDGDDWNMIGNPYPSNIDGAKFWEENAVEHARLTDGLYLWMAEADTPYHEFQSYLVWNPVGATYINDGATPFDGIIPIGCGFWVSANDPDGTGNEIYDVEFHNSMRVFQDGVLEISDESFPDVSNFERERAWLAVTTASGNYEQILVGQHPFATDGIDRLYDAHFNPSGSPIAFASVNQQELFTIQGFSPFTSNGNKDLELYVFTSDTSTHYLTWDSTLYFEGNKELFLVDTLLQTVTQLELGVPVELPIDTVGEYTERFYLRVRASDPSSVVDVTKYPFNGRVWSQNATLYFDNYAADVSNLEVYNIQGQLIYSTQPNSRNDAFLLPISTSGIYVARLSDNNGRQQVVKLFEDPNK